MNKVNKANEGMKKLAYFHYSRHLRHSLYSPFSNGYTLIEVLVAVFLAVNVFAGVMVTYTASIRYLSSIRAKQTGSSNAQMAMNLMEKELYNVNCVDSTDCDTPNEIISIPVTGSSSSIALRGRVQTTAGGSIRSFRFCYKGAGAPASCQKSILYCSDLVLVSCSPATECPVAANCNTSWLTIARNIEAFTVTRSTTSDIQIQLTANEGAQGGPTVTREYYSSVSISYGQ